MTIHHFITEINTVHNHDHVVHLNKRLLGVLLLQFKLFQSFKSNHSNIFIYSHNLKAYTIALTKPKTYQNLPENNNTLRIIPLTQHIQCISKQ